MTEPIDDHLVRRVAGWLPGAADLIALADPAARSVEPERLLACFDAQLQSRHLDLAARWLQQQGEGFYTIGSAGHESNAAVALALRPTDPALLHYRSGGFYCRASAAGPRVDAGRGRSQRRRCRRQRPDLRRSAQGLRPPPPGGDPADVHDRLAPAAGVRARLLARSGEGDRCRVTLAGRCGRRGQLRGRLGQPLHDARSPQRGGLLRCARAARSVAPGVRGQRTGHQHSHAGRLAGGGPVALAGDRLRRGGRPSAGRGAGPADEAVRVAREGRRPVLLRLRTVRFMGHAGSDVELAYRSRAPTSAGTTSVIRCSRPRPPWWGSVCWLPARCWSGTSRLAGWS